MGLQKAPISIVIIVEMGADSMKYVITSQAMMSIPGSPIAYWVGNGFFKIFKNARLLSDYGDARQGLITGNNERFLRFWHEVVFEKTTIACGGKWSPYDKGGEYRKWFGNNWLLVNWERNGYEIKNYKDFKGKQLSRPQNVQYYGKESITWTALTSGRFNGRYSPQGYLFDAKGSSIFPTKESIWNILSFLNSCVANYILSVMAPTLDYNAGVIARLPYKDGNNYTGGIAVICKNIAKLDWDSFEISWDFKKHPLI